MNEKLEIAAHPPLPIIGECHFQSTAVRGANNHEPSLSPITAQAVNAVSLNEAALVGPGYIVHEGVVTFQASGSTLFPGYVKPTTEQGFAYIAGRPEKPLELFDRASRLEAVRLPVCYTFTHYNFIYGHFLLEMVPRLFLIREMYKRGFIHPIAVPLSAPAWVMSHARSIFPSGDFFQFDDARQKIEAERLIAIAGDFLFNHPWIIQQYRAFAAVDHLAARRKVFLVRPDGHKSRRSFANQDEFAAIAEARGFDVVDPSRLSLKEQAVFFAQCSLVAGEFNSSLHNTIFSPPGAAIVAINRIVPIQWRIANACGHYLDYVTPEGGNVDWSERVAFTADPREFEAALDSAAKAIRV